MNYDFNENDEILDPADTTHEERDVDVKLGKRIAREKKYNALVGEVTAGPMDDDCLTSLIERDMGKEVAENIVEVAQPSPVNEWIASEVRRTNPAAERQITENASRRRTLHHETSQGRTQGRRLASRDAGAALSR
jgi:hypothetical protein